MCGIVVMMSNDKLTGGVARAKAFTQGVIVDTLRGPHSTGLVYTDYDGVSEIYKKPIPGYDFVNMPKFNSILKDPELYPFMIAHNRYATKGKVNTANAHPFQHGNITGVHNGSLYTWKDLAPDQYFDTDSEYIIHALAYRDTGEVLEQIDGAFALVWHDASDNTLHVARNDDRTFYIAHIDGKETVLGASELEMLNLICARNDLTIKDSYLVNTEVELVFKLDDLHNPQVIERKMMEPWSICSQNGYVNQQNVNRITKGSSNTVYTYDTIDNLKRTVFGYITGFEYHVGTSGFGYIKGKELEEPYTNIRINGFTEYEYNRIINNEGSNFEGTLVGNGIADDGRYLMVSRTGLKHLNDDEVLEAMNESENDEENDDKSEEFFTKNVRAWDKREYTLEEADRLLERGCCLCGGVIPLDDFSKIEWWNNEPICNTCDSANVPFNVYN